MPRIFYPRAAFKISPPLDGVGNAGYSPPQVTMNSPQAPRSPIAGSSRGISARLLVAIVLAASLTDRGSLPLSDGSIWSQWNRGAGADRRGEAKIDNLNASIARNLGLSRPSFATESRMEPP